MQSEGSIAIVSNYGYKKQCANAINFVQLSLSTFVFQVVVVLQQVFALIQTVLSKWLNDSQVVEVSRQHV